MHPAPFPCAAESSSPQARSRCKDNRQVSRCLQLVSNPATTLLSVVHHLEQPIFSHRFPAASFLATERIKVCCYSPHYLLPFARPASRQVLANIPI